MSRKRYGLSKLGVIIVSSLLLGGCASPNLAPSAAPLKDDFKADVETQFALTVGKKTFDLEQLEKLGATEIEVLEPFRKKLTKFTVIDFDQLLLDSGFSATDQIETIALNDYRYKDSVQNFIDNNSLLAIYENGAEIAVSDGGPVRIIFTEDSAYYSLLDAWNWSLSEIKLSGN